MGDASKNNNSAFDKARDQILTAKFRDEIFVQEIPSPNKIAPNSLALAAGVKQSANSLNDVDSPSGSGRLILLNDPDSAAEWESDFRIIIYALAPLEEDIGSDKFIAEVAWAWLLDSLSLSNAEYKNISGTATNIISTGFGGLKSQGTGSQIELRASWSPEGTGLASHATAWSNLLCSLAGFPEQEGTISMDAYRLQSNK